MTQKVRIWDLPTRLFHWTLVGLFGAMWYTGETGGDLLQYHIWCGYGVATLVLFRLIWGVLGSETARFRHFVKGPSAILAYLKGRLPEHRVPGHNPLGALMVLLLLGLLAVQVGTGLFAADVDSYAFDGPLAKLIDGGLAEQLTAVHKLLFNGLLAAVGLHLAAIVFYRLVKKQNLVEAMLSGYKKFEAEVDKLVFTPAIIALVTLLVSAGSVYVLVTRL